MNTKLSRTILSATLLAGAFALAGCGGGDDTPAEESGMSADDRVAAAEAAKKKAEEELAAEKKKQADAQAAEEKRQAEADAKAMMATAGKLHAGISAQMGDGNLAATADTDRDAGYNTAGTAILVSIGNGLVAPDTVTLMEDKKAMVAALHGWDGKKYTVDSKDDGTYEAIVYSNVGDPKPGEKFGKEGDAVAGDDYMYGLTDGMLSDTDTKADDSRVASPSFDQSAGVKEFKLPDNSVAVKISGSYHGVSGTYSCDPDVDNTCAVKVTMDGFDLGGTVDATNAFAVGNAEWKFEPADSNDRVMSVPDGDYVSYGWWLKKSEDGSTYTASAFHDERGTVPAANITELEGTANYSGGAAGKYALHSLTGGTNDAGHFTAKATLNADFNDNKISGTIDTFMGADGESRDWSVALNASMIADDGGIAGNPDDADDGRQMTVWTRGGTAAEAGGEWVGTLQHNGDDTVPMVATGTFHAKYGSDGNMVGAFGATKQ